MISQTKELHEKAMDLQRLINRCDQELKEPNNSEVKIKTINLVKAEYQEEQDKIIETLAYDNVLSKLSK